MSILITQCLQNDFIAPIGPRDPLPNTLHIGYEESMRLMGKQPRQGMLWNLMKWAYGQPASALSIINIRDWHDDQDPAQQVHLKQFGPHCLQHTEGANFVFDPVRIEGRDAVVNASGMNDFYQTDLAGQLAPFAQDETVRVGLVGVWTEAKITFLAYELATRYPNFEVGVCSALTASSTTHMHFIALDQLADVLGITVLDSVTEFASFLTGKTPTFIETPAAPTTERFAIEGPSNLQDEDHHLLHYLYKGARRGHFEVLDGGYSGNVVMKATTHDLHGHEEVPSVVKIGPRNPIAREKAAFEKVKDVLGHNAPSIISYMESQNRAGIKYRYASRFGEKVITFQRFYEAGQPQGAIDKALDVVFRKQLGRFYKAATIEKVDLMAYYQFDSQFAQPVLNLVANLVGEEMATQPTLTIGSRTVSNVARFYSHDLDQLNRPMLVHQHHMSYIHGDLNGANIIIDEQKNVWLIDFFHTHRGHVLKDLIKLENDILCIFLKTNSALGLEQTMALIDQLIDVRDLRGGLPAEHWNDPAWQQAYDTIAYLRSIQSELVDTYRGPYQLWLGLLRYAVHTLSFDECNHWQKQAALYAAGRLTEKIMEHHQSTVGLRLDYLEGYDDQIGMTILPGRKDRNRELAADVQHLVEQGIEVVFPLITTVELEKYGVPTLVEAYEQAGLTVYHLAIVDQGIPTQEEMGELVDQLKSTLADGKKLVVHCVGGVGRTGTALSAFLIREKGWTAQEAISCVRRSRSPRAVENEVQEEFVRQFALNHNGL